jgi:hypothetical protein
LSYLETVFAPVDQQPFMSCGMRERIAVASYWVGFVNSVTPFKLRDIDDTATMGTLAYLPHLVPGLNLEYNAPGFNLNETSEYPNHTAHRGRRKVVDVDLHSNADKSIRQP